MDKETPEKLKEDALELSILINRLIIYDRYTTPGHAGFPYPEEQLVEAACSIGRDIRQYTENSHENGQEHAFELEFAYSNAVEALFYLDLCEKCVPLPEERAEECRKKLKEIMGALEALLPDKEQAKP